MGNSLNVMCVNGASRWDMTHSIHLRLIIIIRDISSCSSGEVREGPCLLNCSRKLTAGGLLAWPLISDGRKAVL